VCVGAAPSQRKRRGALACLASGWPATCPERICVRDTVKVIMRCALPTLSPHSMHASRGHEFSVMRVVILQQHGLQK